MYIYDQGLSIYNQGLNMFYPYNFSFSSAILVLSAAKAVWVPHGPMRRTQSMAPILKRLTGSWRSRSHPDMTNRLVAYNHHRRRHHHHHHRHRHCQCHRHFFVFLSVCNPYPPRTFFSPKPKDPYGRWIAASRHLDSDRLFHCGTAVASLSLKVVKENGDLLKTLCWWKGFW